MCEGGGLLQASPSTGGDILTAGGASERLGSKGFGDAAGRLGNLVLHGGGEKVGSEVAGNEEGKEAEERRATHFGR